MSSFSPDAFLGQSITRRTAVKGTIGAALASTLTFRGIGALAAQADDFPEVVIVTKEYSFEMPATIDIDHLETPSPLNPLGIKGAGEAGVIPSAAVFAAAIEDAEGVAITAMPISPSDLFTLRQLKETK